jgi:hypothetical protein
MLCSYMLVALAPGIGVARGGIPSDSVLVKRAILSEPDSEPVLALLLLFDSWNSEDSLRVLASFSNYYLGEASGALYDCLVLRKGKSIRPYLEEELRSNRNECRQNYSEGRCRSSERKERIGDLISRINRGESCSDKMLEETW